MKAVQAREAGEWLWQTLANIGTSTGNSNVTSRYYKYSEKLSIISGQFSVLFVFMWKNTLSLKD